MNKEFQKDIQRAVAKENVGELTPGATPRRYEPAGGVKKLNERIHRESSQMDKHGNLPFTFSKPKKSAKSEVKVCNNCDAYVSVTKNTVGVICSNCKTYSSVREVSLDGREEEKQ